TRYPRSDRFPSIVAITTLILRRCGTRRSIHSTGSDLRSHNCLFKHPGTVCSVNRSCSAPYPHNSLLRNCLARPLFRSLVREKAYNVTRLTFVPSKGLPITEEQAECC